MGLLKNRIVYKADYDTAYIVDADVNFTGLFKRTSFIRHYTELADDSEAELETANAIGIIRSYKFSMEYRFDYTGDNLNTPRAKLVIWCYLSKENGKNRSYIRISDIERLELGKYTVLKCKMSEFDYHDLNKWNHGLHNKLSETQFNCFWDKLYDATPPEIKFQWKAVAHVFFNDSKLEKHIGTYTNEKYWYMCSTEQFAILYKQYYAIAYQLYMDEIQKYLMKVNDARSDALKNVNYLAHPEDAVGTAHITNFME